MYNKLYISGALERAALSVLMAVHPDVWLYVLSGSSVLLYIVMYSKQYVYIDAQVIVGRCTSRHTTCTRDLGIRKSAVLYC